MPARLRFDIRKDKLVDLYFQKKWSMFRIADYYGCTHGTIVHRFKKYGLVSRGHLGLTPPLELSKDKLERLYVDENLSVKQIANNIGRSKGGVERRIMKFGIKTRGNVNRKHWKYIKKPFSGSLEEKAYMIGFRLGDLNVYRRKQVIVARGSTTKKAQVKLFEDMFSSYGGVSTALAKRGTYEHCAFLDKSFEFLVPKQDKIEDWIVGCPGCFLAFFAGYFDAEGSLVIHKDRSIGFGGFEVQSYDKNIIITSWKLLSSLGVDSPVPLLSTPKGYVGNNGLSNNGDTWRLSIFSKASVWKISFIVGSLLRHGEKTEKLKKIKANIVARNKVRRGGKVIDLSIPSIPNHSHKKEAA